MTGQTTEQGQQWFESLMAMARDSVAERAHPGGCTPETPCDTDCVNAYHDEIVLAEARVGFTQLRAKAALEERLVAELRLDERRGYGIGKAIRALLAEHDALTSAPSQQEEGR